MKLRYASMALTARRPAAGTACALGGLPLTWSDNGNLLADGTSTYQWDHANRLIGVTQGADTYAFSYNALGDRVRQTVNGVPTSYTLDLEGGLTQVLADGANAYLYGHSRLGEEQPGGWVYHLPDALGSVRQLADGSGGVTLAHAFEPYGDSLASSGAGDSAYGYTGEWMDGTGLVHLRARYYAPYLNRFTSRDPWEGDPRSPETYNVWAYTYANPVNHQDPSGHCLDADIDGKCDTWPALPLTPAPRPDHTVYCSGLVDPDLCGCSAVRQYIQAEEYFAMLPMSDTPEKAYRTLMDPAYMDKWWRSLDDGVEMVLAVISYVELYSIGNQTEPIEAATEALARRYWDPYACAESCSISGGKIPVRFKWIMRYAQSFKSIATSIHPQLLVGGSPDFAIRMAQSILAYRRMPNYERPWGWFNTQTEAEHDYFKEHFRQQRDTDRSGVYFRVPARGGISDWYVMTRYQQKEHCTEETGNLCGRPMQEQD